jgi:hypothetical protein
MQNIITRLELIQNAISLDDKEVIELQISKLQQVAKSDKKLKALLSSLKTKNLESVAKDIDTYITQSDYSPSTVDTELHGLRLKIKSLHGKLENKTEKQLAVLSNIKSFNTQYMLQLGDTIDKILAFKQKGMKEEILEKEKELDVQKSNFSNLKEQLSSLKNESNALEDDLEKIDDFDDAYDDMYEKSQHTKKKLGKVETELQEKRLEIRELQKKLKADPLYRKYLDFETEYDAFKTNYRNTKRENKKPHQDDSAIQKTLKEVMKTYDNFNRKINDKKKLRGHIDKLQVAIQEINSELESIEKDETYTLVSGLNDWDTYFNSIRQELEEEYQKLKNGETSASVQSIEGISIGPEKSDYANKLIDMFIPTFEKVRRVSNVLNKTGNADDFNKEFAEYGRKYKALIYSAINGLEDELLGKTINITDWYCGQGIASALFVDYIREKQLDINVKNIYLIDPDEAALSRAMVHVDVLMDGNADIHPIPNPWDEDIESDKTDTATEQVTIHLLVNASALKQAQRDKELFENLYTGQNKVNYFVTIVEEETEVPMLENFFDIFRNFKRTNISERDKKVGKFQRYEKIFKVEK